MFGELAKRPAAIAGSGAAAVCVWLLITNWGPIAAGHPTYLIFYVGLLAAGVLVAGLALRNPDQRGRLWLSIIGAVLFVVFTVIAIWLKPFGATDVALTAMEGTDTVAVTQDGGRIVMEPTGGFDTGVIFYPGARVDARAYANILMPLAEAGNQVVIVKEPLGIAFFSTSFADRWIADNPGPRAWIIGGHSLGGAVSSLVADGNDAIDGLLLYASFPASDISGRTGLEVSSIYGTNDGLATPEQVEASVVDLPSTAVLVPIVGAIHSDFGDYGLQPGDGTADITRPDAQAQIAEASLELIDGLATGP